MLGCPLCDEPIEGDQPAIGLWDGDPGFVWIEFVEDLRSSAFELVHPACFARDNGVERLVEAVHHRDTLNRGVGWDNAMLRRENEELRRRLGR